MPTIQEEKRTKPRSRSRKADQRSSKGGQKQVEVRAEADPARAMVAEPEVAEPEIAEAEVATADIAPAVAMEPVVAMERVEETALVGEVLPPEVLQPVSQVDGFQAIAQAYGEYTKKSWLNGRFLMERLIAARTFDEAIEIQGEFAKQAYTNFLTQSERICGLYGAWTQQFFRPLEKLATGWPRN
jgi:Phasin protein